MKRILLTLFLLTFLSSAVNAQWDKRGGSVLGQEEGTDLGFISTIDAVGAGIVASISGNVLTLTVAGGGAATFTVKEGNVQVANDINVLDFAAGFDITAAGGEAEITLDFSEVAGHDLFTDFVGNEHIDHTAVILTGGVGIAAIGDISANRTITVDLNELTTEIAIAAGDFIAMVDITDSGSGKITFANFEGDLNHDSLLGFVLGEHIAEGTIDHGSIAGLSDDDHSAYENELNDSAGLIAALSDETGTLLAVFSDSPVFTTNITVPIALISNDAIIQDDLQLDSDAALFQMGEDQDVVLTHVADTGILLALDIVFQFGDAAVFIGSDDDSFLDLDADGGIRLNGPTLSTVKVDFSAAELIISTTNADKALADSGEVHYNTLDEQLSIHSGAGLGSGEIIGEASISFISHISTGSFDPGLYYDSDTQMALFTVGDDFPEGLIIDEWKVSCNVDPDVEMDLDLVRADAFIGLANASVMDILDTTAGVSTEDTDANINSGAAVANGQLIYLSWGADPEGTCQGMIFEMWFHGEED